MCPSIRFSIATNRRRSTGTTTTNSWKQRRLRKLRTGTFLTQLRSGTGVPVTRESIEAQDFAVRAGSSVIPARRTLLTDQNIHGHSQEAFLGAFPLTGR